QYQGNGSNPIAVSPEVTQLERSLPPRQEIPLNDMYAASKVIGVLDSDKKVFEVRSAVDSSLADLKTGPVVLVGVFDNDWGRKMQNSLRFRLSMTGKYASFASPTRADQIKIGLLIWMSPTTN